MASADSLQTDCSAALSRFSRVSQDKARSFHTVQAESTMRILDRVSGVSIHGCLTSCALVLYSELDHSSVFDFGWTLYEIAFVD